MKCPYCGEMMETHKKWKGWFICLHCGATHCPGQVKVKSKEKHGRQTQVS
ncbi:MAG: hypothetical protein ACWGQW_00440 [bacterium]